MATFYIFFICKQCFSVSHLVQFSSVQDGICALGKACMRPLKCPQRFLFETVPMFVWLTMAISSPFQGRSSSAFSLHAFLLLAINSFVPEGSVSSSSTLQSFREASLLWGLLCPPVSARSFPFTPACPGQFTQRSFWRWMSTTDTFQSGLPIPLFIFFAASSLNLWGWRLSLIHISEPTRPP